MALAAPAVASAAETVGVEEVIVTAQKRPENVQDVPMSISAISGDQLEKANISTVADVSRFVPSLSIQQSTNNRNSSIVLRNVGTSGTNPGTDQDVGVFVDGVYVQVAGPVYSELSDISTVEVLRGPQGTLYGRNTPVGAINITTRAPTDRTEAENTIQYGNDNRFKITGLIGGGLAPDLAGRVSYWYGRDDGEYENIYDGSKTGKDRKAGVRGRLRWTPGDDTTVDLIAYYSHAKVIGSNARQVDPLGPGGIVFGYNPTPTSFATSPFVIAQTAANPSHPYVPAGKFQVNAATDSENTTNMYGVSGQITHDLPQINATITDILAYNSYYDHTPNQSPGGLPLDITTNEQRDKIRATSNELRIASDAKQKIDYVGGVYYYHSTLDYDAITTVGTMANRVFPASTGGGGKIPAGNRQTLTYAQDIDAIAIFGQVTLNVTDQFRVTAGGRWSRDKKTSSIDAVLSNITGAPVSPVFFANQQGGGSLTGKRVDKDTTWSLGAQYDLTDGVMAYVIAGTGYKDGGFNSRSAVVTPYTFDPETSRTYEAGIKSTLFDRKLILNVDVFRMKVNNYQQSTLTPQGVGFVIGNAGNFRNQGVEVDAQAAPIEHLSLKGSLSYIKSKIVSGADRQTCDKTYPFQGSDPPPSSGQYTDSTKAYCNFNGLTLPLSPKVRGSLAARWEQPLASTGWSWFVSGSMNYQSSQYMDASLDPRAYQSSYTLFDGNLGVTSDDGAWRVSIWGKNLSNKEYFIVEASQTQGANISGGGTRPANGFIGWMGQPRTYGIEVNHRW
ncbi:TonB-dependent receptor [Phenylobacterium sp.]|uniref:TonB-dependent receptor n=1 Tax=Phenylobacterium sp. TaxID=1871053 RepID=UPI0025EE4DE2|nr:TonB-dependent receptor [Phenylobacterium sp.]